MVVFEQVGTSKKSPVVALLPYETSPKFKDMRREGAHELR